MEYKGNNILVNNANKNFSVESILSLRTGTEEAEFNKTITQLEAGREHDRIPVEQFAMSAAVRNSRKAAKKAMRAYDALPEAYKLKQCPAEWPVMNSGVPETDMAYLAAMSVLMYEQEKANAKPSPESYSAERLDWVKKEMPATMEILRTAYSAWVGAYEQGYKKGPEIAASTALMRVMNAKLEDFSNDNCFESLGIADACSVMLLISKFVAKDKDIGTIDLVLERILCNTYAPFGEGIGGAMINELDTQIRDSREADAFLRREGVKDEIKGMLRASGGSAKANDYFVKTQIVAPGYLAVCAAIMRELGYDINLRTAMAEMPLSYEDIIRTMEWQAVLAGYEDNAEVTKELSYEAGGVMYYLFKVIKRCFDAQLDAIEISDTKPAATVTPATSEARDAKDQEIAALRSRVAALEADCKNLRSLNAAASRRYDELAKQSEESAEKRKEHMDLKQEVAELRSLVYELSNKDNDSREQECEKEEVSYPYPSPAGIVVVGGHDNWCANMSNRFPDIRFLGNAYNTDPVVFRQAACIVMQCSYVAHPVFWKALNVAREKGIPVHYISGHSLAHCSNDLIKIITQQNEKPFANRNNRRNTKNVYGRTG